MNKWQRLWLVALVGGLVFVILWLLADRGEVEVRVVDRDYDSFSILVHNGTRKRVYISKVDFIGKSGKASMTWAPSDPDRFFVAPNSEAVRQIECMRTKASAPVLIAVFPWSRSDAESAKARWASWPRVLQNWFLRKYASEDPKYHHSMEVPPAPK